MLAVFCIHDFKSEIEKLRRKNSYSDIEQQIINYFFDKKADDLFSGVLLNNNHEIPYIKKRLGGSAKYRAYYYMVIKNNCLYLMYVHPKTGSLGIDNLNTQHIRQLYKNVLEAIKSNQVFRVTHENNKLVFDQPSTHVALQDV